jgi:putative Mn2+ efflux pump MntP
MGFIATVRTMDKRLRLMLLSTALLLVPGIGQFVHIRDLNTAGRASDLALVFAFAVIFIIPTTLIFSGVIIATIHRHWRRHQRLAILGALNIFIGLNLIWFFLHACSWAHIFGINIRTCS